MIQQISRFPAAVACPNAGWPLLAVPWLTSAYPIIYAAIRQGYVRTNPVRELLSSPEELYMLPAVAAVTAQDAGSTQCAVYPDAHLRLVDGDGERLHAENDREVPVRGVTGGDVGVGRGNGRLVERRVRGRVPFPAVTSVPDTSGASSHQCGRLARSRRWRGPAATPIRRRRSARLSVDARGAR